MKTLLEKIRDFFNTPCMEREMEEQFYQSLQDMKEQPEKHQHALNGNSGPNIPPVSLF